MGPPSNPKSSLYHTPLSFRLIGGIRAPPHARPFRTDRWSEPVSNSLPSLSIIVGGWAHGTFSEVSSSWLDPHQQDIFKPYFIFGYRQVRAVPLLTSDNMQIRSMSRQHLETGSIDLLEVETWYQCSYHLVKQSADIQRSCPSADRRSIVTIEQGE